MSKLKLSKCKPGWDDSIHDLQSMYGIPVHLQQCKRDAKAIRFQKSHEGNRSERQQRSSERLSAKQVADSCKPSHVDKGLSHSSSQQFLNNLEACSSKMDYYVECISQRFEDSKSFQVEVLGALRNLRTQNEENSRILRDVAERSREYQSKINTELESLQSQISTLSQQILNIVKHRSGRDLDHADSGTLQAKTLDTNRANWSVKTISECEHVKPHYDIHVPNIKKTALPVRYELITDENSVQPIRIRSCKDSMDPDIHRRQ